jgi:Zn-finger nucleic acid-binding protein
VSVEKDGDWICPRCDLPLERFEVAILDEFHIERCSKCFGMFLSRDDLTEALEDVVQRVREVDYEKLTLLVEEGLRDRWPTNYIKCPVCTNFMNRRNYGSSSGVVMDTCKDHGVWLDGGEFNKLLRWAHAGGIQHHARQEKERDRMAKQKWEARRQGPEPWDAW